ncbi:hypothetical protein [Novosphingobium resinovorum]|uniref:hypothetical protein n=1 Tax=Novosphingobium resinovorum TaxID=158500 RepID=UPI0035A21DF8
MEDDNFTDAQKATLVAALEAAGVDHKVETYPARHGWGPRDTAAHSRAPLADAGPVPRRGA